MRKRITTTLVLFLCILLLPITAAGHSGRTDSSGGHRDNKNKSGLGSYHYHCGGYPAHLHDGGVCPYTGGGGSSESSNTYTPPKPSISIANAPTELHIGDNSGLEYSVSNATSSESSVTSSDSNIVRVNPDNTLTAVGEGVATITVSASEASSTFTVTVKSVPVESITIEQAPSELQLGNSQKLEHIVAPENATVKTVSWSSSDNSILEVSEDGTVTAKGTGNAVITCQAENGVLAECAIDVFEVFPESIQTDIEEIKLECGKSTEFQITILPEHANNKNYELEAEGNGIVELTKDGTLKGLSDGETHITITTDNGISKVIPVTVFHEPVSKIKIDDTEVKYSFSLFHKNAVDVDDELLLLADVEPKNATFKDIQWESSDPEVISIEEGEFRVNGKGEVVLTAVGHDGVQQTITLNVIDEGAMIGTMVVAVGGLVCAIVVVLIVIKKRKTN
ncbi:MAG TPA: Ig-like domain-containing protein [Candidatus Pelethocola excrementipullorum]|nr:Ig-like domain-containing protein [Candidatus Pelethocola excrementipullorum]